MTPPAPKTSSSERVKWLFLDLNSYFASVEQHLNPELRGKPVAVVPVMSDTTCAIAASYQAKKFGVKTGTNIGEAKRMCPGLILVEAGHDRYVEYHHKVIDEVEHHYPVQIVASIDEVGLLLDERRSSVEEAVALAKRIKAGLAKNVSEVITCSIGIAPNRYLAKVASDLKKPDGLEVLHVADLPGRLLHCKLTDLPGIGRRMEPRLHEVGIHTLQELWDASTELLHEAWGGIQGDRFWKVLHGEDLDELPTERRSISHSHVLAPEFRKPPEAEVVAKRLVLKTASRLRRMGLRARSMTVKVRAEEGAQKGKGYLRFAPLSDSYAMMQILNQLWVRAMDEIGWRRVKKIGVILDEVEPITAPEQLDLFPALGSPVAAERKRRESLSRIMDDLNQKHGRDSIALGFAPDSVKTFSGTKIAFTRIPDREEFKE